MTWQYIEKEEYYLNYPNVIVINNLIIVDNHDQLDPIDYDVSWVRLLDPRYIININLTD